MISICIPIYNREMCDTVRLLANQAAQAGMPCEIVCIESGVDLQRAGAADGERTGIGAAGGAAGNAIGISAFARRVDHIMAVHHDGQIARASMPELWVVPSVTKEPPLNTASIMYRTLLKGS